MVLLDADYFLLSSPARPGLDGQSFLQRPSLGTALLRTLAANTDFTSQWAEAQTPELAAKEDEGGSMELQWAARLP